MSPENYKLQFGEKRANKAAEAVLFRLDVVGFVNQDKSQYKDREKCGLLFSKTCRVICGSLASLFFSSLFLSAQIPLAVSEPSQTQPCGGAEDGADSPALERLEIQQLMKLSRLGSTTVLYSHNNKLSLDAWEELGRTFKARGYPHMLEWMSSEVYLWDNQGDSQEKRKRAMHAGNFAELIDADLQLDVHEPILSNLKLPPKKEGETPVEAKGFEYDFDEPNPAKEKDSERTRSELGRVWATLAQRARARGSQLVLKISSNRFSEADMLDIVQKGARIELNLAGATRYDARVSRAAGTPTGYEKVKGFLRTVKNRNLSDRLWVRYNNKSLEEFLLESKAGSSKAVALAGR
ncbi:MAG: hypothetical protein WCO60_13045 [Verrucomicrobiota bacterium]